MYRRFFYSSFAILLCLFLLTSKAIVRAADIAIDTTPNAAETTMSNTSPAVVFTTDQTGYVFYGDSGGNCVYSKTTNAGSSWGAAVQVDSVNTTDCIRIAVWYDKWTPGDTGSLIHIATIDTGVDDVYYTQLNTSNDALSASVLGTTQGGTLTAANNFHTITKGTDGKLYMAVNDAADSWIVRCSATCTTASNWAEITNPYTLTDDWPILMPLAGGSIMAIRLELAGNDVDYKIWNGSTWSASWTTIGTTAGENTTYDGHLGAGIDPTNNNIYLAWVSDNATLGTDDDIKTALYNGSWTAKTDVLTNDAKGITNVKVGVDQSTGDVYAVYSALTTPGTATTGNVYYKKSTDDMATWGTQTQLNDTADDLYGGGNVNLASSERIYTIWDRGGTTDDLYGDTVVDIVAGSLSVNITNTALTFPAQTFQHTSRTVQDLNIGTVNIADTRGTAAGWDANWQGINWTGGSGMDYNGNGTSTGQLCLDYNGVFDSNDVTVNSGTDDRTFWIYGTDGCFAAAVTNVLFIDAPSGRGAGDYTVVTNVALLDQFIPASQGTATYSSTLTLDLI